MTPPAAVTDVSVMPVPLALELLAEVARFNQLRQVRQLCSLSNVSEVLDARVLSWEVMAAVGQHDTASN